MEIEQIGPYRIDRKIGSGGMGTVYLARHEDTDEQVALKTLSPALAQQSGFVQRFHHEIHSLARLTNPHVVRLIDSGSDNDTYYYAMEYVEGETVTQRLRRVKRIPWEEVVDIAIQVCSALKAAHDAGIIHRDIKPSNLLLDANGQVKLTDFGIAKLFAAGKLTATDGIIGTAEYMSPEQAQGNRVTKASDLYSLGAVMYTMLAGRPPYTGKSALEVIQKHKYGQFDRPARYVENLPHWLDDIVCGLLSKTPDERPPDAYVLSRRLSEVLKKVELSQSDETRDALMANTATSAQALTQSPDDQPISGTLVRDLVRHELDNLSRKSPIEQFFDNTWVLVGLLLLIIAGGFWWFRDRPQELASEPPTNVSIAMESDAPRQAITRLNIWLQSTPGTEVDQFVQNAVHDLRTGNLTTSHATLQALGTLIESSTDPDIAKLRDEVLPPVQEQLENALIKRVETDFRPAFVGEALQRAETLVNEGRLAEARQIWNSIALLYESDPRAQMLVQDVRSRIDNYQNESSPTSQGP